MSFNRPLLSSYIDTPDQNNASLLLRNSMIQVSNSCCHHSHDRSPVPFRSYLFCAIYSAQFTMSLRSHLDRYCFQRAMWHRIQGLQWTIAPVLLLDEYYLLLKPIWLHLHPSTDLLAGSPTPGSKPGTPYSSSNRFKGNAANGGSGPILGHHIPCGGFTPRSCRV